MYDLIFSDEALEDLRFLKKFERTTILDTVAEQLRDEPLRETRNRKPLRENVLSKWELRIDRFRVFYDVDDETHVVMVKAVGWKDHNALFFRGKEYRL